METRLYTYVRTIYTNLILQLINEVSIVFATCSSLLRVTRNSVVERRLPVSRHLSRSEH